ncbi:hypothetical protein TorRG33x02_332990 [Trema orientale]|uniref:F-box associated domain-containing protein n=1 Tax=Trema orientale TaxID=63057 RepID=A0A2P5B4P3_TREOI|nr:hypothetical protein TorRG33x02_332990 [Trema orientale]
MFDEVFHDTVLPNYLAACQKVSVQLAVWNESIALFVFMREISITKFIQVWVPGDSYDGVNGRPCSWIKKLTIGPSANIVYPLTFLKNDEVLMRTEGGRFFLYNLHHQMYRVFTMAENTHPEWECSYVKSLLSVQGGYQSRS